MSDASYNAESRYVLKKFIIHFSVSKTLEATVDNVVVSSSLLEESYNFIDSPFGSVTANELSLTLFNENDEFNPANVNSPYYGLIKKGIKIEVFIKAADEDSWNNFGVYYVTDWATNSTGLTADITADDMLYNILNSSVPALPVYRNVSAKSFITSYFSLFGVEVNTERFVDVTVPYIYTSGYSDNKKFLSDLMLGCLADCFCDHSGNIVILSKSYERSLRATLTDADQIINITIKQSISTSYDSAVVTYRLCSESSEVALLDLKGVEPAYGIATTDTYDLTVQPALSIHSIRSLGNEHIIVDSFQASASDISFRIINTSDTTSVDLEVTGTTLDTVYSTIGEGASAPLSLSSNFIQSKEIGDVVHEYAVDYVEANVPTLELNVRGNPLLQLGDKIAVQSTRYHLNYVGTIIKADYKYDGHLSCKLTLAYSTEEATYGLF